MSGEGGSLLPEAEVVVIVVRLDTRGEVELEDIREAEEEPLLSWPLCTVFSFLARLGRSNRPAWTQKCR